MSLLHDNINANLRVLMESGMTLADAKVIVIALAGKVILDHWVEGNVVKVVYSNYGVRGSIKFNAAVAA